MACYIRYCLYSQPSWLSWFSPASKSRDLSACLCTVLCLIFVGLLHRSIVTRVRVKFNGVSLGPGTVEVAFTPWDKYFLMGEMEHVLHFSGGSEQKQTSRYSVKKKTVPPQLSYTYCQTPKIES